MTRHPSGAEARVEYVLDGQVVGFREFDAEGELMLDCGLRNGRRHGTAYRLDMPGKLLSATPYVNGLEHGVARQWSDDGRLIGSYRMRNGTGVDLWWQETLTTPHRPYLAEVLFMVNGRPHGCEWWLNEDQSSVYLERHWRNGEVHGIEREWNEKGKLRRGFPKLYVRGERVTWKAYERESSADPGLPTFRPGDDRPDRRFPPTIARRLASNALTSGRQRGA